LHLLKLLSKVGFVKDFKPGAA
jgi:hypothetical protein